MRTSPGGRQVQWWWASPMPHPRGESGEFWWPDGTGRLRPSAGVCPERPEGNPLRTKKEPDCSGSVVMRSLTLSPNAQKGSEANHSLLPELHCQQDLSANPYRAAAAACDGLDSASPGDVQFLCDLFSGRRTSLRINVLPRDRTSRASGVCPSSDIDSARADSLPGPETRTQTCLAAASAG
jgi:hypothetical protein